MATFPGPGLGLPAVDLESRPVLSPTGEKARTESSELPNSTIIASKRNKNGETARPERGSGRCGHGARAILFVQDGLGDGRCDVWMRKGTLI